MVASMDDRDNRDMAHTVDISPAQLSGIMSRSMLALTKATFPDDTPIGELVDNEHMLREFGLVLSAMPWTSRFGVRLFLWIFTFMAFPRYGRTFGALNSAKASAYVDAWIDSRFAAQRFMIRALLTLVKPTHIGLRAVKAQMGYPADRLDTVELNETIELPRDQHIEQVNSETRIRCQVVIIGTGAGGATLACELAEQGIDVVMLEAGRFHDPRSFGQNPAKHLRDLYWNNATTVALGRPGIPIPLGRTVGGTTTINSATCFRTPDRVLDRWMKDGLLTDRGGLEDAFQKVEERLSIQTVSKDLLGGSSDIIARGSEALGLRHGPLQRNMKHCRQSAVCAFGCPTNAKQSTNITYVPWAMQAGARLYTRVLADRILRKNGRAAGIEAHHLDTGHTLTIDADIVVSACGAIAGIPFLAKTGVRNRHLGRHLSIHPGTKIVAKMNETVDGWQDTPQGYGIYELFDQGIMFEGAFVPPEYASIAYPFAGKKLTDVLSDYRQTAIFGLLVSDEPNGRVRRGPGGEPVISYWLSQKDANKMTVGLRMLAEVFFAAGAERIYLPIAGAETHDSIDSALNSLRKPIDPWAMEVAAFHPLGTARMSQSPKHGVIKPTLECHETPGLYIVDGSIFPSSLGVNPQVSIMGYATMTAAHIAEQLKA
jgi:choline dehydrogenase-like flavoprotein